MTTTMTNASTPEPVSGAAGPAERLAGMLSPAAIDGLLADAEASGTAIDGPDGLLARMTKAVLEGPAVVCTVLRPCPLRELPEPVPARSPAS